ncbi:hypothetical protein RsS62_60730 [Rhizobium dioscoreae]|uniref:Uncharacterized protein n=1 Tax=Rhizobium dioscoreae TaxID=2653122 RepID=A0ABQ0ZB22_9HYPH|nr:hypothetical protein RsS62_60730 [Rhizobium dioscoreae]GES52583.1 hypothetical protein RsS93_51970 [Rhizobium dioscoreae]GLU83912.1 hypothetical protein Rhsp01_50880 [Rhizobium sp. NBRC 114257]
MIVKREGGTVRGIGAGGEKASGIMSIRSILLEKQPLLNLSRWNGVPIRYGERRRQNPDDKTSRCALIKAILGR